jgi:hypothetical protein
VQDVSSPALKWLIAVLLPLTLVWKLTVTANDKDHPEKDVIAFLTRRGFDAVMDEGTNFRRIVVVNSSCRMLQGDRVKEFVTRG